MFPLGIYLKVFDALPVLLTVAFIYYTCSSVAYSPTSFLFRGLVNIVFLVRHDIRRSVFLTLPVSAYCTPNFLSLQ